MRQFKISKQITERSSYAMERYLMEISKIKALTPAQEAELAIAIKQGDKSAVEQLVLGAFVFSFLMYFAVKDSWSVMDMIKFLSNDFFEVFTFQVYG